MSKLRSAIALCLFTLPVTFLACGGGDEPSSQSSAASGPGSSSSSSSGTGGGVDTYRDPMAIQMRLSATLDDLAKLGSKRAGTQPGQQAGDYVKDRFTKAGISDVSFESFDFLSFNLASSSLAVTVAGQSVPMKHDVFQYSGKGHVDADIIDVGKGHDMDYMGKDVTGKIALVTRDPTFHREAQYRLAASHGAAAMLYISQSPKNLIQIGTVDDPEDGLATIPTVTIGADDGKSIVDALGMSQTAHAVIDVDASVSPATGRNVVAKLPGTDPSGAYIVVGAHYDTWYVGSTDNGTGVAALLEAAEAFAHHGTHKLGIVFVGYDGEELGLFGGYDFLRRHVVAGNEPMLAFVNLEMPGAPLTDKGLKAIAHTQDGPIDAALVQAGANMVYPTYVGMELVPAQFGGLIPTDIQGMYWYGIQGYTTYCETQYYHTPEDTPEKIDIPFLATGVVAVEKSVEDMDPTPPATFHKLDHDVWMPDIKTTVQGNGDLQVDVTAKDATGAVQAMAEVTVWVDVDDFTRAFKQGGMADAQGKWSVAVPKSALDQGKGHRWLHVTTGQTYPLSERMQSLP